MSKVLNIVLRVSTLVAGLSLIAMMALIGVEVFMRTFNLGYVRGAVEYSEVLLVIAAFAGMAYAQRSDSHVSTSMLTSRLSPVSRDVAKLIGGVVGVALVALIVVSTVLTAFESIQVGEARFGLISVPIWPARMIIAGGMIVFMVEYIYSNFLSRRLGKLTGFDE